LLNAEAATGLHLEGRDGPPPRNEAPRIAGDASKNSMKGEPALSRHSTSLRRI
jgi:hypothetical protein